MASTRHAFSPFPRGPTFARALTTPSHSPLSSSTLLLQVLEEMGLEPAEGLAALGGAARADLALTLPQGSRSGPGWVAVQREGPQHYR